MSHLETECVGFFPVASSPRVQAELTHEECVGAVVRHLRGDWGDVSPGQQVENNRNVETDYGRLFSVYRSQEGEAFWVFTEDDRSLIVILFPEEYEGYLEFIRKHTKTVAAVQ